MNRKPQTNARKIWAVALIVWGALSAAVMFAMTASARGGFRPQMLISPAILLLIGILLLPKKDKGLGDFWKTDDPSKAKKAIRKVRKLNSDSDLITVGREAPLEEVALAAFETVRSKEKIVNFIRFSTDEKRRMLAQSAVDSDPYLRDIAKLGKEPASSAALERIGSDAVLAEIAAAPVPFTLSDRAVARMKSPEALLSVANNRNVREALRCEAYTRAGKPLEAAALTLSSLKMSPAAREKAAAELLASDNGVQIIRALGTALAAPENPQAKEFALRAAKAYPQQAMECRSSSWGAAAIRATALRAMGQDLEAASFCLASGDFSAGERREAAETLLERGDEALIGKTVDLVMKRGQDPAVSDFVMRGLKAYPDLVRSKGPELMNTVSFRERKEVGEMLLASGDEAAVRNAVNLLLNGERESRKQEFVLQAASAFPDMIRSLWPKVREWGHVSSNQHTDNTTHAPHVDTTRYYDFYRYPDGRTVPNRSGRQTHTDGPLPSSDCAEYGHTDINRHTDNSEQLNGYLGRFPKAVRQD